MDRREDRRSSIGDRRFGLGRRMLADRRRASVQVRPERRGGNDRRSSAERRVTFDRRASVRRFSSQRQTGQPPAES
jgi:hypothetical protein